MKKAIDEAMMQGEYEQGQRLIGARGGTAPACGGPGANGKGNP